MKKVSKILLIVLPVIFIVNFLTLSNGNVVQSSILQSIGDCISLVSFILFVILIIYLIVRKIKDSLDKKNNTSVKIEEKKELKEEVKKENNRIFNLIWIPLFGIPIGLSLYNTVIDTSASKALPLIFSAVGVIVCLLLVMFKRNNFFIAFILLVLSLISNFILIKFYNLTWLFSPNLETSSEELLSGKLPIISGWGIIFLIVMAFVYVSLSSWSRVFLKKTKAVVCFVTALLLTCISSFLLFFLLSQTFVLSDMEIDTVLESSVSVRLLDGEDIEKAETVSSVESSTPFFVYVSGLQKGKRYGRRIVDEEGNTIEEEGSFKYCMKSECSFNFGQLNTISDRLDPGIYTIQVVSQNGDTLKIVAVNQIEVTELEVSSYDESEEYPCEMWLTLGDSDEKLWRIDAGDQGMTDITVMVQCDEGETYDAQIAVGDLSQNVQYFQNTIYPTGEAMAVLGLGGNTSHGYVRLIIDNQVMGEAIVNRGFPICDNGKIVEGGQQSDCK